MSRHKLVKNLDLDDELYDFDGGDDYDYEGQDASNEELSEEDQENMRIGTIAVRADLPPSASHITDKQIQQSLWHTYYNVDKTVSYLISTFVEKPKSKAVKMTQGVSYLLLNMATSILVDEFEGVGRDISVPKLCSKPFSYAKFFKDTPWLNVPVDRQTLFVAPLYPRIGLPGGSPNPAPKVSKLQALAAARKKKSQENKTGGSSGVEHPMASLKLTHRLNGGESINLSSSANPSTPNTTRGFPLRKRNDSSSHQQSFSPAKRVEPEPEISHINSPPADQAEPSAFANTMFNSLAPAVLRKHFTMPYTAVAIPKTIADPFAGPSPDDMVFAAQSKAAGKIKPPSKTNGQKKLDNIASGVDALQFDDAPKAKIKNLDVLKEFESQKIKNAANFVVIGHVDAGKSTLMGRLLLDLDIIDQRTVDRYKKEAESIGKSSFALAWVLDQGSEERARGVTIDIATNKFETETTKFTILDAPGHRDFIPNMIAGASQADFAVLVVDARTGSFESGLKGQTKEHALLVRSLGVQRIIVAVNKLDTVLWSQERFIEIENQLSAFLSAVGFLPKNICFVPCSGLLGDNISRRSTDPQASWYTGPTLLEFLESSEPISRALTKPLRLAISEIFRGGAQNSLSISGRIEAGSLQMGEGLLAQPSAKKCFIKALELDNQGVEWAVAGQNIVVHLSGIEEQDLKVGDVLCSPMSPIRNVREFTAKVLAFEFLLPMPVDVHRGRLYTTGKLRDIVQILDKTTGFTVGRKKPKIVKPGQVVRLVVELDAAVPLEAPGRIVLRSGGETVAAGLLE